MRPSGLLPRSGFLLGLILLWPVAPGVGAAWDTFSDTWVATDDLGRALPTHVETGPPRPDRQVGLFYFLWHGQHIQGGPYDVTKVLQADPGAMDKKESPLWGPLHAPHHWGESIFGYYLTDDEGVLRKHAQMLEDAGVDAVIFDVSNQVTYRPYYEALLKVFREVETAGGHPPRVAFLCPFWDPARVVERLYRELYEPGLYPELWYRWEGKPIILADPAMLQSRSGNDRQNTAVPVGEGRTLGQSFQVEQPLLQAGGRFPTWRTPGGALTLTLRREGPNGPLLAERRFEEVEDNAWLMVETKGPQPPGLYYLEVSRPAGRVGWWSHSDDVLASGQAYAGGQPVPGDRTLRLISDDPASRRLREFFTFRKPQPDYFRGPTGPDMWSWLEVYPQHVFTNAQGQAEQMSVGVAQNAVAGRLGSMSEPGAWGRSMRSGQPVPGPDAIRHGYNAAQQWDRALAVDPRFIFVTGWNEWIAGRFDEFNGVRRPVMFVDQFDQEHSRDIEPMKGGHGDDYYYQMIGYIRRYKGVRALAQVVSRSITVDGQFADWQGVSPEFRDTLGDPMRRDHRGWDEKVRYANQTGRQDLRSAKVSRAEGRLHFYVRTREPLLSHATTNWMLLFLDTDANPRTGWLGYDFVVNRSGVGAGMTAVERNVGGRYAWDHPVPATWRSGERELELAVPVEALGWPAQGPATLHFKWADNILQTGEWSDFTLHGDAAPNDRFQYRAEFQ